MWKILIDSILATVLPFLEKAVLSWLAQRLHIESAGLPPHSDVPMVGVVLDPSAKDKANKLLLLQKVRDGLWFIQFAKINAVEAAIARVKMG